MKLGLLREQVIRGTVNREQLMVMVCEAENRFDEQYKESLVGFTDGQLVDMVEISLED